VYSLLLDSLLGFVTRMMQSLMRKEGALPGISLSASRIAADKGFVTRVPSQMRKEGSSGGKASSASNEAAFKRLLTCMRSLMHSKVGTLGKP